MKKILALAAFILAGVSTSAQVDPQKAAAEAAAAIAGAPKTEVQAPKPNYWTNTLMTQMNMAQTSYTSWAKGGNNNVAMSFFVDGNANYAKDKATWKNRLQMDYGFLYSEDKPIVQKNKDRMLLESTLGYRAAKNLNYTVKFTFLNQFTNGYDYKTPSVDNPTKEDWKDKRILKSGFLSPATVNLGIGMDWVPSKWLSVNFAPLTGGFTIVTDETLRKDFGMNLKKDYEDFAGEILPAHYRGARFEFGAQLTADAKLRINKDFEFSTHLLLFSNYLKNPLNLRVNWDNRMMWKLAKYFTLTLTTNLVYDETVLIKDEDYPDGHQAVQFLEALQFGFTYTFANKK